MEKVKNCQDPEFCKKLVVDYYLEKVQKLKFGVYDVDNKSFDLNNDDYLGGIECALDQVVSSSVFTQLLELKQEKPAGKGTITGFQQRRLRIPGLCTWKLKPKTWTKRSSRTT